MGIFDTIQAAIASATGAAPAQPQQAQQPGDGGTTIDPTAVIPGLDAIGGAGTIVNVNVEEVLDNLARQKGRDSHNWRVSIVEMMALLDLDSSLHNREQLADELGYTGQKGGSAEMNIFLHRKVMEQLAANGGVVPDSLKH